MSRTEKPDEASGVRHEPKNHFSGYQLMWILVMFDLPVGTKEQMRAATRFREYLLDEGFEMAQFSIYARFC